MLVSTSDLEGMVDELRTTLGKLEIALGSVIDSLVWINTSGDIQWSNVTFDNLVGKTHLEVLGAKLYKMLPLLQDGNLMSFDKHPANLVFKPEGTINNVYKYLVNDKTLTLDISGKKVDFDETNISAIFVIHDITEKIKKEEEIKVLNLQLEQRVNELTTLTKELEAFSYSVSHDLRLPLRIIDGFSSALLEDYGEKFDVQGKDFLQRIRTNCTHMSTLIDDLLNLSKVVRSEVRHERVELNTIAQKIFCELQKTQPGRKVQFAIKDKLVTTGDSHLLYLVLENLITNAWKFTSKRQMAHIEFGALNENGELVYFIKDDGAGFDITYVDKLFTPFQRLHKVTEFPGTGIGLATVQRIIHKHGGKVWAKGEIEKGATIYFTLG